MSNNYRYLDNYDYESKLPKHHFGQDFTRELIVYDNDSEPVQLPSQSILYHLFSTQPSLEDALNGEGAFTTFSGSWTQYGVDPFKNVYSINALSDPDTSTEKRTYTYWECLKFVAQVGAQVQSILRPFQITRIGDTDSDPEVDATYLKNLDPNLETYITDEDLVKYRNTALDDIKLLLKHSYNVAWADMFALNDMRLALGWKTIELCWNGQIQVQFDRWYQWRDIAKGKFQDAWGYLKFPVDTNKNNIPDSQVSPKGAGSSTLVLV